MCTVSQNTHFLLVNALQQNLKSHETKIGTEYMEQESSLRTMFIYELLTSLIIIKNSLRNQTKYCEYQSGQEHVKWCWINNVNNPKNKPQNHQHYGLRQTNTATLAYLRGGLFIVSRNETKEKSHFMLVGFLGNQTEDGNNRNE